MFFISTFIALSACLSLFSAPVSARKTATNRLPATLKANVGATLAADGSTIVDMTATIGNVPLRFKVSAPASQFIQSTNVATTGANSTSAPGLNVLLHGDGGQSFFDFPNQNLQGNLMGVVILAPNQNRFWGGGSGLQRTDGVLHSQLINSLIKDVLPTMLAFDTSNVQFTGVSGGSLLLSGFFMPAFISQYTPTNVLLNCGALTPQVAFANAAAAIPALKIHYQSTTTELSILQTSIPVAIKAYEKAAVAAGLSAAQINSLQTANAKPNGGHCEFDGKDFVTGVQLMADSFSAVMQGGTGQVTGIGSVLQGVVGNENLFG